MCNPISKTRWPLVDLAQDGDCSVTILRRNKNAIRQRILRAVCVGGNACSRQRLLRAPNTVRSDSPNLNALCARKLCADSMLATNERYPDQENSVTSVHT